MTTRVPTFLCCALLAACFALPASAQQPDLAPWEPELEPPLLPTVIFTYSFPGAEPSHFAVAVNSVGNAAYESRATVARSGELREPYMVKFVFTEKNRERVFSLLRQLNHFEGDFDYRRGRVAQTGVKTLIYKEGSRRVESSYNWSEKRAVQELTELFHRVSASAEFERRLRHLRRYDRLGLDAELRAMEKLAREDRLEEVHILLPVLREIASDAAVMRLARDRAQRLLRRWEAPETASRPAFSSFGRFFRNPGARFAF